MIQDLDSLKTEQTTLSSSAAATSSSPALPDCWKLQLQNSFQQESMNQLRNFLKEQYRQKKTIYPEKQNYFRALQLTPFDQVRVVILGQDPYHGPGQAHGLCFSVQQGVGLPPSLQNIFKERKSDVGIEISKSGDLSAWAKQGVLLLNAVLTVEAGQANSHQGKGWEKFTDDVIQLLNEKRQGLVFVLWGAYAQKKGALIDRQKHLVLECVHPSPLSSHRGFFGSKPFSKINDYLMARGEMPIDWNN